jgi:hypothetical protein
MNIPVMYFVGLISNLVFLVLSIWGYFYVVRKTGNKFLFIILFAAAWLVSALSYILLISGTPADVWYITCIRITNYILFLAATVSLIVELIRIKRGS